MYFNYVLLFMGITDLILGLISYFRKGEAAKKYLLYSYKIINEELEAKIFGKDRESFKSFRTINLCRRSFIYFSCINSNIFKYEFNYCNPTNSYY